MSTRPAHRVQRDENALQSLRRPTQASLAKQAANENARSASVLGKKPLVSKSAASQAGTSKHDIQNGETQQVKVDPSQRPALASKSNTPHQSRLTSSALSTKSKPPSTIIRPALKSGQSTVQPDTAAKARAVQTPARSKPKKTITVYTPAPPRPLAPDPDDEDEIEYMPPKIQEMAYEPAYTASYQSTGLDNDLFEVGRPYSIDPALDKFEPVDSGPSTEREQVPDLDALTFEEEPMPELDFSL